MTEKLLPSATLIDGRAIAAQLLDELRPRIEALKKRGISPSLAAVLVGDDPASSVYVATKEKTATKLGLKAEVIRSPATTTQRELESIVEELNRRSDLNGYIIQSPLPDSIDEAALIERIDPFRDIDGFHPYNVGLLTLGHGRLLPCTPAGIVELLVRSGFETRGREIVILGRGNIVGRPLSILLSLKGGHADGTVTVCHSRTANLADHTRRADILILAMGTPAMITGDMVKPGAVVIDVGVNRVADTSAERGYRLVGDADFESVSRVAGAITPVPGGVGPMTVAMLMRNTVLATEMQHGVI